jgi:hypothetical protein
VIGKQLGVVSFVFVISTAAICMAAQPIDIGSRLEPLVDDYLIESLKGVALTLHEAVPREVAIVHDEPWEGNCCAYHTVFQDGSRYRMYYRGAHFDGKSGQDRHEEVSCCAESKDGIHWTKPTLGLIDFRGSKANNLVWSGPGSTDFAPFKDANPACTPAQRYKALAWDNTGSKGLLAFQSPDGIHWTLMQAAPVITKGDFDSQNLAFWDSTRQRYVEFHRKYRPEGVRDIMTSTSTDFLHWTDPVWLEYPGAATEELYTNQITPYDRAPHVFLGFPMRYVAARCLRAPDGASPGDVKNGMLGTTDGVFMTSRDGVRFHRWGEALIRPGLQPERWVSRNNLTASGVVRTKSGISGAPDELSIYSTEGYFEGNACRLRRFTVRLDGFVSARANSKGGELRTKRLTFAGDALKINFSTSAAGSIRVELQDTSGKPIPGFTLDDCPEIFGDQIDHVVTWKQGSNVSKLAGELIRIRFVMKDADLYAIRF